MSTTAAHGLPHTDLPHHMPGTSADVAMWIPTHEVEPKALTQVRSVADLPWVERVAVMHQGELLAIDTPETIMANPTVQSAYLGDIA